MKMWPALLGTVLFATGLAGGAPEPQSAPEAPPPRTAATDGGSEAKEKAPEALERLGPEGHVRAPERPTGPLSPAVLWSRLLARRNHPGALGAPPLSAIPARPAVGTVWGRSRELGSCPPLGARKILESRSGFGKGWVGFPASTRLGGLPRGPGLGGVRVTSMLLAPGRPRILILGASARAEGTHRPATPVALNGSEIRVRPSGIDGATVGPRHLPAGAAILNATEVRLKH